MTRTRPSKGSLDHQMRRCVVLSCELVYYLFEPLVLVLTPCPILTILMMLIILMTVIAIAVATVI